MGNLIWNRGICVRQTPMRKIIRNANAWGFWEGIEPMLLCFERLIHCGYPKQMIEEIFRNLSMLYSRRGSLFRPSVSPCSSPKAVAFILWLNPFFSKMGVSGITANEKEPMVQFLWHELVRLKNMLNFCFAFWIFRRQKAWAMKKHYCLQHSMTLPEELHSGDQDALHESSSRSPTQTTRAVRCSTCGTGSWHIFSKQASIILTSCGGFLK